MKAAEITDKKPLSVGQVAEICKVSNKTVLNWIYSGGLKAFTTYGGHYRLWPSNVCKFLRDTRMDIPYVLTEASTRHVVIIHSDPVFSGVLRDALGASFPGVEVTATDDGYVGMILIGEIQPALVILDTGMSGIEGMRLVNVLNTRKGGRDVKIIAISRQMDRDPHPSVDTTGDVIIEQNPEVSVLLKRVATLLDVDSFTPQETVDHQWQRGDSA